MPIVRDASITQFYSTSNVRVGQINPAGVPELSELGTPPLADQYGRYIVLIDGTANVRVTETLRYPVKFGFINPAREGILGTSASMKALTRVWGSNSASQLQYFHIRLVDSASATGVIAVTIPIPGNFGYFSQELYLPFEIGGFLYDTMYFDLSDVPDAIVPTAGNDLRLSYNYLGTQPVAAI